MQVPVSHPISQADRLRISGIGGEAAKHYVLQVATPKCAVIPGRERKMETNATV